MYQFCEEYLFEGLGILRKCNPPFLSPILVLTNDIADAKILSKSVYIFILKTLY